MTTCYCTTSIRPRSSTMSAEDRVALGSRAQYEAKGWAL